MVQNYTEWFKIVPDCQVVPCQVVLMGLVGFVALVGLASLVSIDALVGLAD